MKTFGKRAAGLRLERMTQSPLWSGEGFRNVHPVLPGLRDTSIKFPSITDFLRGGPGRVPARPLPHQDPRPPWQRAPDSGLRATWLGHSSVLLEVGGARLLTDPVWGPRASPSRLVGPKRFQAAPVSLRALPPLDAVLLSHDHYDHLDYPTIRELARADVPFITSLGVGAHLESWGIPAGRIVELDWWQSHELARHGVSVTAAPSQHFSGRGLKSRNSTLWSSLVVRSERHRVFFSGDTGLTTEYENIRARLGPFDLVMLEVGAFHPAWGDIHLGPDNALKALKMLGGGAFLPIHWGTFSLALHDWDEPVETLLAQGPAQGARLLLPRLGQALEPTELETLIQPWWRESKRGQHPGRPTPSPAPSDDRAPPPGLPAQVPWPLD